MKPKLKLFLKCLNVLTVFRNKHQKYTAISLYSTSRKNIISYLYEALPRK